ncbi:MAG TPA: nitroreductase family protein [Clostridia bacterium]|nr:nitroreductase family protein [Clostridia bacterium]
MDIQEAIFTRRSIRRFTGEAVDDKTLELVIKAGCQAPSAHNRQPWHFVVVRDEKLLKDISEGHPYAKMLPQAGCAVIVCGDKELEGIPGFITEDCSAAIENMLLMAHGNGLGTVWCGIHPVGKLVKLFTKLLNLPEQILPVGMVVIGRPAAEASSVDRYDAARVHKETW